MADWFFENSKPEEIRNEGFGSFSYENINYLQSDLIWDLLIFFSFGSKLFIIS